MCGATQPVAHRECSECGEWIADSPEPVHGEIDWELVRRFRREIHGLAGIWIFFGVVCLGIGLFMLTTDDLAPGGLGIDPELADPGLLTFMKLLLIGLGVFWFTSGLLAAMKHRAGVILGLGMSYLSLAGNLMQLNVCGLIIVVIVIIQSHRVLKMSKEMIEAGLSLDFRP